MSCLSLPFWISFFPGVCFNTVLLHSDYNCEINVMVIESKKGGARCADRAVVFIHI